jgi:hypothetical protein
MRMRTSTCCLLRICSCLMSIELNGRSMRKLRVENGLDAICRVVQALLKGLCGNGTALGKTGVMASWKQPTTHDSP